MQPIDTAIENAAQLTVTPSLLLSVMGIALIVLLVAVLVALIAVLVKVPGISKRSNWIDQVSAIEHIAAPQLPRFEGVDPAVVAAISAAVAAYAPSGKQLVVRSVRRTSAWSDAGRRESLNY